MKKIKYGEDVNFVIWFWKYEEEHGTYITGRYTKTYKRKGNAERVAREVYTRAGYNYLISKTNPFIKKCPICGKEHYVNKSPLMVTNSVRVDITVPCGESEHYEFNDICGICTRKIKRTINELFFGGEQ